MSGKEAFWPSGLTACSIRMSKDAIHTLLNLCHKGLLHQLVTVAGAAASVRLQYELQC